MRDRIKYVVMSAVMSAMMICTLPVYGTTVRDNYVHFTNAKLKYFAWDEYSHKITYGQPWDSISSGKTNTTTGYIHVRAGRSGSTEVATWFKDRAKYAVGTRVVSDVWPEKLNFAFYGHMRLHLTNNRKTVCHKVVIGQGHTGAYNNWWIGGEYMHHKGDQYWLECIPSDEEVTKGYCRAVVPINTSGSYTFPLDLWMCPPAASMLLSSDELWPANGKMHEIEATIIVDDACDDAGPIEVRLTSVESNEEPGIEDDIQDADIGEDDRFFRLRAESDNDGDGRVYTVTYDITDRCGEESTLEATVTVPHDKGKNPPPHFRGKK